MYNVEKMIEMLTGKNVSLVSKKTGLHANTIYKILWGKSYPHKSTQRKLNAYIDQYVKNNNE